MHTVSDLYAQRILSGQLRADPAQQALLPHMDRVLRDLHSQSLPPKTASWRAFFGGGTPIARPHMRGLYLWGGVGRGKSMLMDLMAEAAGTIPCRRVHFHEFMQEIHEGLQKARDRGDQDIVRPVAQSVAKQVRLLCFDEMQITDIADAMIVGRLFQVLLDEGVMIVTTSNRRPEDLYQHGLNRALFLPFIAMISRDLQVIALNSPTDYRQNRIGHTVWFTPADTTAKAALDVFWSELTGNAPAQPHSLNVLGRQVSLSAMAGTVARSDFWALCGQALGPADYLAISRHVSVLLLDSIPHLSSSNYNEAKRFVTLIDALYEAKVRLIASAADIPEHLYHEGEGSFEFERTASRLREMQDAQWGQNRPTL